MASKSDRSGSDLSTRTKLVFLIFALAGLLLIAVSLILGYLHRSDYVRELLKELGIVLFAVFTVSLVYEWLLAEIHLEKFRGLLAAQIEQAESNAANCAKLGIVKIFPTRNLFEAEYPIGIVMADLKAGSEVRVVANTLFHLMNKAEPLKQGVARGANVELCLLDPQLGENDLQKVAGLEAADIAAALAVFNKQIAEWAEKAKPLGSIDLRCHKTPLPASFSRFSSRNHHVGVWDISFGRDLSEKRVFVVDPTMGIGLDLKKHFDYVFNNARVVFRYADHQVRTNLLPQTGAHHTEGR